ncbi:MAG TPA: protein kinase, partial [Anaerolineales bacterium]
MEDLTGKQFGSYQIVAPLGEGGMAAIYKAYQPAMERFVAIKVLPRHMSASEEFTARFRREARLVAQLQHPHILPVFDYGESEGYPYIVMPFILSGTLADILRNQRTSLPEARRIISQIGDALSYAHARGMIHRDIKPSNILIDESGNCLLTDFGLARMIEAEDKITTSGQIMGTPAYMSPEQGTGSATDSRSDLYSLGIIFYEMLTGRVPYTAETPIAVVFKHVQDPLPSARRFNPSLSEGLELVLLKSLAKNPEERYQTADAFVHAVQQVISEHPSADKTLSEKITPVLLAEDATKVVDQEAVPETESRRQTPPRFPGWPLAVGGLLGLVIIAALMMSRSNVPGKETVRATLEPSIAATELPALVSSPTTVSPTSPPPNTASPGSSFRDEFENQLGAGWTWLAEDQARWSLSEVPGWLQILASDASFDGPSFPTNVLLRDPPQGDFEMTTLLQFTPTSNFQFGGLVVFQDKANVLQFGRAFCDLSDSCVGDGIYFDNFEGGFIVANHKAPIRGSEIYLRLRRVGTTYTGYFSEDGENWITLGEHTRDFSQARVGLMAA